MEKLEEVEYFLHEEETLCCLNVCKETGVYFLSHVLLPVREETLINTFSSPELLFLPFSLLFIDL